MNWTPATPIRPATPILPALFSYSYVLPIFYPLCFDIHACNGGCTPPSVGFRPPIPTPYPLSTFSTPLFSSDSALFGKNTRGKNSHAMGKMERRFRQRRCVYRDALQLAHRPQRRICKTQLDRIVEAALRPRVRREEANRQIARGPQACWSVKDHGNGVHHHGCGGNVAMRAAGNHQADVRMAR